MLGSHAAHATVPVKDLDRARSFYEEVLGLTPLPSALKGVQTYRTGASTLLVYESSFAGTNQATAVTWSLGDRFDAVVQALREKGVAFERYPIPGASMDGDVHVLGDSRVAWFKDPDGNIANLSNYTPP